MEDPDLYLGLMPDNELGLMPPFIITTSEFGFLRPDYFYLAKRGQKFKKLLDFQDMPGCHHTFEMSFFDHPEAQLFYEELKKAFDKYIVNG